MVKRKKMYKRKRKARPSRRLTLSGFPKKKLVKMRYVATGQGLNPAAGSIAQVIFRANSVFDPDYTYTGHQPMSFDQWAVIYNKYTVMSSKITMKYAPATTSDVIPGYFGVLLSSDTTGTSAFSSLDNLFESKLTSRNYKICGGALSNSSGKNQGYPVVTKSFNARSFFGVKDPQDGNASSADVTTNPANAAYFIPWCASIGASQDPGQMNFTYVIDYIVLMHDPKNLDGS